MKSRWRNKPMVFADAKIMQQMAGSDAYISDAYIIDGVYYLPYKLTQQILLTASGRVRVL